MPSNSAVAHSAIGTGLVYGEDERVGAFVHKLLGKPPPEQPFIAIGAQIDGHLVAGAMYWCHFKDQDIYISLAVKKRYLRPEWVKEVLSYAFNELGVPRISSEVDEGNTRSMHLCRKLGFEVEGIKQVINRRMICFGMTKEIYDGRWR